jgi:hypothetical protein
MSDLPEFARLIEFKQVIIHSFVRFAPVSPHQPHLLDFFVALSELARV